MALLAWLASDARHEQDEKVKRLAASKVRMVKETETRCALDAGDDGMLPSVPGPGADAEIYELFAGTSLDADETVNADGAEHD